MPPLSRWERVLHWLGLHGRHLVTSSRYLDYYHNEFVTTCRRCKRVVQTEVKFGDWG